MLPEYAAWIERWVATVRQRYILQPDLPESVLVRGLCYEATSAMVEAFPELRKVRGWYGGAPHWWCVTPHDAVVDPTAAQFEPGWRYVQFMEGVDPEPVGKCMNCGDVVWRDTFTTSACSAECLQELQAEYGLK